MSSPKRILFAVKDPAARRFAVIDKVIHLARDLGARLELFHAISAPVFLELQPLSRESLGEVRRETLARRGQQLEKLAARASRLGVKTTCAVEWDFPPHEAIVRRAKTIGAGLVIVECHQGKRRAPWLVRLTDWETLLESPVPVLLLKNPRRWRRAAVLAAVDPSHAHAKTARLDDAIVANAQRLARDLRGRVEVMHANYPSLIAISSGDPAMDAAALQIGYDEQKRLGRIGFDKFATRHRVPKNRRHLVDAHPADAIPRLARRVRADVVVMGAVSRSALKRVFIGNTAERVLGALPCDVLVVKAPHGEKVVPRKSRGMRVLSPPPVFPLPV